MSLNTGQWDVTMTRASSQNCLYREGCASCFPGRWDVSLTAGTRTAVLDHKQLKQMVRRLGEPGSLRQCGRHPTSS